MTLIDENHKHIRITDDTDLWKQMTLIYENNVIFWYNIKVLLLYLVQIQT